MGSSSGLRCLGLRISVPDLSSRSCVQPLFRNLPIVQRDSFVADDLIIFMALAGDQQAIARLGLGQGPMNRFACDR